MMHESLLKGKAFSSRFWGWGRNSRLSPPLPGKAPVPGRCPPALGPGTPGTGTPGTGTLKDREGHRALPSSLRTPHRPSRSPPAASTTHSRPYRDRPLMSRHAGRLSGRTARSGRVWRPPSPGPSSYLGSVAPGRAPRGGCKAPGPDPPVCAPSEGPGTPGAARAGARGTGEGKSPGAALLMGPLSLQSAHRR